MQYGFVITTGDLQTQGDLAHEAEAAGWDGVFTWDGIAVDFDPIWDPWVTLAVYAMRTERVRLGAMIFPLSRRRPWKVAREALSIDHLSGGRLVLPVGLGATDDRGFSGVGEALDRKTRAGLLDETLALLDRFATGEPVTYQGEHYQVDNVTIRPRPVQSPRIPVWVVAAWGAPKSRARALRYDGVIPGFRDEAGAPRDATPDDIRSIAHDARVLRTPGAAPWDIIVEGTTPADDRAAAIARVQPFAEAGGTWWMESMWEPMATVDTLRARIAAGPPRP